MKKICHLCGLKAQQENNSNCLIKWGNATVYYVLIQRRAAEQCFSEPCWLLVDVGYLDSVFLISEDLSYQNIKEYFFSK